MYLWRNTVNGKAYVGKGDLKRARQHRARAAKGYKQCPVFYNAMRASPDAFELVILEEGLTDPEAIHREKYYIARLATRTPNGYNLTDGGEGTIGAVRSPETKELYRQSKLGDKNPMFGRVAYNKGVPNSPEARAKLSARHEGRTNYKGRPKGYKATPEERNKQSQGLKRYWADRKQREAQE